MKPFIKKDAFRKRVERYLKKQRNLAKQVAKDEAVMDIGFNRYPTFPYTPRDDRKPRGAGGWGLMKEIISQFSI